MVRELPVMTGRLTTKIFFENGVGVAASVFVRCSGSKRWDSTRAGGGLRQPDGLRILSDRWENMCFAR